MLSSHKTSFIYCSKCCIKNTLRVSAQKGRPQALCKYYFLNHTIPVISNDHNVHSEFENCVICLSNPMAVRSKALVCSRFTFVIAGSNLT